VLVRQRVGDGSVNICPYSW